ncbi:diguanylate cyclase [Saccharibacillus sp. CPCC 101409]|uniref:GGDEF domain-containing protein n=1 Tax=Saccharibacillus sp. CPCC 101409 TaxID=3058041 RepID=UPI00267332BF|nr:diguanylate cyclase [Saccharibacillus sp. CPCC 101409]MDO3411801.1 diguanylate cyclase [Saccharibacillus sp. CPCC 101409]
MVSDLFVNFCLLSSFLFFGDMFGYMIQDRFTIRPALLKTLYGTALGLFGVLQMMFTFELPNGMLLDFRQLSIMVSAALGGVWPALLTSSIIAAGRLIIAGEVNVSALIGAFAALLTFAAVAPAFLLRISFEKQWATAALTSMLLAIGLIYYRLGPAGIPLILLLAAVQIVACLFTYLLMRYLRTARELHTALKQDIEHDFLTGLYNSRGFESRYRMAVASGSPFALLLMDIDHFKKVNDTYGHPAGDAVLIQLGKILREGVRRIGCSSRKGGEEFAIILRPCDAKKAYETAEKLRRQIEETDFVLPEGRVIRITVSLGIGMYPRFSENELVEETDRALYRAKEAGRNRGELAG